MVPILRLKHGTVLQEDENEIFGLLIMFAYKEEKERLKPLHGIPKAKMMCAVITSVVYLIKLTFEILLR